MERTWLKTITAALCAAGAAATSVQGSPVDFLPWKKSSSTTPTPSVATANTVPQTTLPPARPSAEVSPYKHPIKYLGTTFSEMPLPGRSKTTKAAGKPKHDSLSLDTPAGPPTPQLKIAMAQICEQKGDVAGARRQYQEALRKWPGQVDVLRAAARMEDRLGQLQLAENLYGQALAANPQHAGAMNDLGICLARQGRLDASIQTLEQ